MNSFVAVGKVSQVKKAVSQNGKEFYTFKMEIPVRAPEYKELMMVRYCTMWSYMKDPRREHLKEGALLVASGTIEGYEKEVNMKKYVNEKFIISELCTVAASLETIAPSLAKTGDKNEEEDLPF